MARKNEPPAPPKPPTTALAVPSSGENDEDDDFDVFGDDEDGEEGDYEYDLPSYLQPHMNALQAAIAAYEQREYGNPFSNDTAPPPSPERLAADHTLALELVALVDKKGNAEDAVAALDERFGGLVYEWLSDVAFNLAEAGKVDAGVALVVRLAKTLDAADEYLGDAASMLAHAGRKEEATRHVDDLLSRFGSDLSVCDRMADVVLELGDVKRAERLTRKVLEKTDNGVGLSGLDSEDDEAFILRSSSLERIVKILEGRGDTKEAKRYRGELESVEESIGDIAGAFGGPGGPMGGMGAMLGGAMGAMGGANAPKAPEWGYDAEPAKPAELPGPVAAVRAGGPKEKPKKK